MVAKRFSYLLVVVLAILLVACGATVPQEEHDQVVADLTNAESQISELQSEVAAAENEAADFQAEIESLQGELDSANQQVADLQSELASVQESATALEGELETAQGEVDSLQSELDAANAGADEAEQQRLEFQDRIDQAAAAADLLSGFMMLGVSADSISDADAASFLLDLVSKVEEINDEALSEKFDALILSEGTGEAETFDLIFYLLDIISQLRTE